MRRRDQSGRVSAGFFVVTGRMYFYHLFKGKDLQDLYGVRVCVCPCVGLSHSSHPCFLCRIISGLDLSLTFPLSPPSFSELSITQSLPHLGSDNLYSYDGSSETMKDKYQPR